MSDIYDISAGIHFRNKAAANFDSSIIDEIIIQLGDRLADFSEVFNEVLVAPCWDGASLKHMPKHKVKKVIGWEPARNFAKKASKHIRLYELDELLTNEKKLDAIICPFLAWETVPQVCAFARAALRENGVILIAGYGANSFPSLSECLVSAELALTGKSALRVMPGKAHEDFIGILKQFDFTNIVTDREEIPLIYENAMDIFKDLRNHGAQNRLIERCKITPNKKLFELAMQNWLANHDQKAITSLDVIFAHGIQPQPLS